MIFKIGVVVKNKEVILRTRKKHELKKLIGKSQECMIHYSLVSCPLSEIEINVQGNE